MFLEKDLVATFSEEELQTLESIRKGLVPDHFPSTISPIDDVDLITKVGPEEFIKKQLRSMTFKDECQNNGQFGYISKAGAKWLTDRFPNLTWLDPLAGRGWFYKALKEQGAMVYAGDIEQRPDTFSGVLTTNGKDLVHKYRDLSDILLLSWVEKDNVVDYECAMAWGSHKPILVYGEPGKSCNSSEFNDRFVVEEIIGENFPDLCAKPTRFTSMYLGYFKP